ncbi:hypothetical protein BDV06DRAFT_91444 [Aspergillus oleicola]
MSQVCRSGAWRYHEKQDDRHSSKDKLLDDHPGGNGKLSHLEMSVSSKECLRTQGNKYTEQNTGFWKNKTGTGNCLCAFSTRCRLANLIIPKLCTLRVSSLGWPNEDCVGVQKDHAELTMYPRRSDEEGYFQQFMDTLSKMIDEVTLKSTQHAWVRSDPSDDQNWLLLDNPALRVDDEPMELEVSLRTFRAPRIPCYVTTPYEENPDFVGRADTLAEIHSVLSPTNNTCSRQRVFALTGLGGMGKTQTAIRYAFQNMESTFKVVLWAHADGQSKLSESFSLFTSKLGLGEGMSHIKAKQAIKNCLARIDEDWLMIFDNADGDDKAQLLAEFWPQGDRGSILITSRDHTLTNQYPGKVLRELEPENAVDLLLRLTSTNQTNTSLVSAEDRTVAGEIVKRVGFLPLGIRQAANLIITDSCSLAEFLEAYNLQDLIEDSAEIRLTSGTTYKYSLRTVWNMNFEKLNDDHQALIKMMAFLDPDRIQMQLLDGGARSTDPNLNFINSRYKVTKCRAGLLRSSLVTQNEDKDELRMHRLVQACCQLKMTPQEAQRSFENAISLVKEVWPVPHRSAVHNPSLWGIHTALLPHVQKLCEFYVASCRRGQPLISHDVANWDFPSVLYEAGWFCYESGMIESVADLLRPAETYCLRHRDKGGGYRLLADIYGGLGSLCTESNQFQGAYENFVEEWDYLELAFKTGELEKPSIWEIFALGRLGNGHHGLHRYAEAETFYRKALDAWGDLSGDRKLWTSHLATCLWLQGRPDEGETVVRAVIKDENDTTNFRTAMAMYALGNIQIAQAVALTLDGKKEDAEAKLAESMRVHVKVLKLWTITLGARHHKTADAMHKVGWHFHRRQEYSKAMEMFEKALDIYASHPKVYRNEIARTNYKMGCLKQDTKHYDEGTALIREAERIRQEIVPPEEWEPAKGEEDFDNIVQFWTR